MIVQLCPQRIARAKRAFTTRRVDPSLMCNLIDRTIRPFPGDVVLARVDQLGKQRRIELVDGRRAAIFPGDEIVICYGNRYAPDQFEAEVGIDLSSCQLVAAGGVAAHELGRNLKMPPATKITPIGLIAGPDERRLNLRHFRVEPVIRPPAVPVVLSLGTSMNAGKTMTSMSMVRGFKRAGLRVAALKATGTGSGGDLWIVRDAGADVVLDFTDAGFASTYLSPIAELEEAFWRLLNAAEDDGCDIAVVEIADGLQQLETAQMIDLPMVRQCCVGVTFAAYDFLGAKCGVDILRQQKHNVLALSGRLGLSHLAVREAEAATGVRVLSPREFQEGGLVPAVLNAIEQMGRSSALTRRARTAESAARVSTSSSALSACTLNRQSDVTPAAGGFLSTVLPHKVGSVSDPLSDVPGFALQMVDYGYDDEPEVDPSFCGESYGANILPSAANFETSLNSEMKSAPVLTPADDPSTGADPEVTREYS